ncbi:MAG: outer membrane protein transport protein [Gammaproteobacteria bacterium]|nr:outer membrane protein transport protein [Gammaproteobacteria bacterium]
MTSAVFPRAVLGASLAMLVSAAAATNGYSPTGFGTINKGLAGAGVALPQDAMAGATNPAGMIEVGNRIDAGLALFAPDRGFTAETPGPIALGTHNSRNDVFLIPHFGWSKPLDENRTIGILVGANGGMNTEYNSTVWQAFNSPGNIATSPTGVDFAQLFMGVSYAQRLSENHSVGIMPILAVQRFKAEGLEPFQALSTAATKVSNNGYDYSWGYGVRIGWLGQFGDRLSVGASAQSRLFMTEFDDYEGLFAEQGDFDVPPTITVGLAFKATPDITLVADWQRIFYSNVASLHNPNNAPLAPATFLGADDGLGFGWRDIDIIKLGVQWQYSPRLTLRAGVSHADQLFDNGQALFNVLAPATVRTHASLGMTYRIDQGNEISVAYTRALREEIDGTNPLTGPQQGFVAMDQHELEVSWSWQFD